MGQPLGLLALEQALERLFKSMRLEQAMAKGNTAAVYNLLLPLLPWRICSGCGPAAPQQGVLTFLVEPITY